MRDIIKKWFYCVLLVGVGVMFSISAAFVCAGVIMFIWGHLEMSVLFAFAVWLLHFGWRTRDDLGLDD